MTPRRWQLRAASSPKRPVAIGAHSARAMLGLLAEGRHIEARDALAAALAGGHVDAIRAAMDRARAVLPPQPTYVELRAAELAAQVAQVTERAELDRLARELGSSLPDARDHDAGPFDAESVVLGTDDEGPPASRGNAGP